MDGLYFIFLRPFETKLSRVPLEPVLEKSRIIPTIVPINEWYDATQGKTK